MKLARLSDISEAAEVCLAVYAWLSAVVLFCSLRGVRDPEKEALSKIIPRGLKIKTGSKQKPSTSRVEATRLIEATDSRSHNRRRSHGCEAQVEAKEGGSPSNEQVKRIVRMLIRVAWSEPDVLTAWEWRERATEAMQVLNQSCLGISNGWTMVTYKGPCEEGRRIAWYATGGGWTCG